MFFYTIVYGIVGSFLVSGILMGSIKYNPRLWLQDYPKEIQQKVTPKTKKEKLQSNIVGVIFLLTLFIIPLISNYNIKQDQGFISFQKAFLNALGIEMIFNIVDWIILDWLIFCTITPRFIVIPGTEGMKGYKDYGMHFKGFVIGTGFSVVVSLLIASISIFIF